MSLALLGLCILSWFQAATWRSGVALWTHVLEQSNGAEYPAAINLGESFSEMGWFKDAETQARRGVAQRPDIYMGHMNLGVYLERQGRNEEAIPHFLEAVRLNPTRGGVRKNLGMALFLHKELPRAEEQLQEALRLRPTTPKPTTTSARSSRRKAASRRPRCISPRPGAPRVMTQGSGRPC